MWSEAKLGHLLLSPFSMLETGYAWTLIMMKWLGFALGRLEPWLWWNGLGLHLEGLNLDYDLLVFAWNGLTLHLEGIHLVSFWSLMLIMHIHHWWAQVLGLDSFKKQISISIPSRVQSQAFGLEFIHSIQGSNNYDGLKRWTWAHHGLNNGQTHA